jgi:hypothetical protein
MIRRSHLFLVLVALGLSAAAVAGCSDNPVGRICDLGIENPDPNESVVASPSLDCQSRTCLKVPLARELPMHDPQSRYPTGNKGLCTAECESDSDCDRVPESPCQTGFTCAVPVVVGPFCCRTMCICKDYIVIPDGGVPLPAACEVDNAENSCCNLAGRKEDPTTYPNCANL